MSDQHGHYTELLKIQEVAQLLQVSSKTVRTFIAHGRLTAFKIGGVWRIPRSALRPILRGERGL